MTPRDLFDRMRLTRPIGPSNPRAVVRIIKARFNVDGFSKKKKKISIKMVSISTEIISNDQGRVARAAQWLDLPRATQSVWTFDWTHSSLAWHERAFKKTSRLYRT